jgi:molybdate transport system substrate-binding protein
LVWPPVDRGRSFCADVHVLISAGFYGVYSELGPAFERASGHRLITTRGPSMGDSPEAIPTRLARGETADVVILDGGAADELGRRGVVRAGQQGDLARSQIGMVVRAGVAKPDIGSVEAFRNTLLGRSHRVLGQRQRHLSIDHAVREARRRDQVAGKSRKVRGPPSGEPVAAVVARGEAEIGFQQVSELIHVPWSDFRRDDSRRAPARIFFAARSPVPRGSRRRRALIRFLASPRRRE